MVLELTKLEYQKKWYLPNYFANSVLGPNISKMNGNGPFRPSLLLVNDPSKSSMIQFHSSKQFYNVYIYIYIFVPKVKQRHLR